MAEQVSHTTANLQDAVQQASLYCASLSATPSTAAGSSMTDFTCPPASQARTGGCATATSQGESISTDQKFAMLAAKLDALTDAVADSKASQLDIFKTVSAEHSFKKKGNKLQFHFNNKIKAAVSQAQLQLRAGKLQKADSLLEEGLAFIERRNKLILLADNSEYNWALVEAYESNGLASDEEDDRRIKRAEAAVRAERKRKAADINRAKNAKKAAAQANSQSAVQQPFLAGNAGLVRAGLYSQFPPNYAAAYGAVQAKPLLICHLCHGVGHVQRVCPSNKAPTVTAAVPDKQ